MKVKNNTFDILNAINDYAFNCGLVTNEENAYEAPSGGTNGRGFFMWAGASPVVEGTAG